VITAIVQFALLMAASFTKGTGEPDARARVELHPSDAPEVIGYDVPRGRPIGLAEAGPAGRLVAPGRLERAPGDTDVEDALAHALRRIDRVGEPTQPDHVPALAIVRIGVEQVVGDVLHDLVDLAPGHFPHPRVRVRHGGVRVHVLERDLLARHDRDPPPETGRERDLRVAAPEERVEDHLVERAVEVAAPVEQRFRDCQPLAQLRLVRSADLVDQLRHVRIFRDVLCEDRDQAVAIAADAPVLDVEVQPTQELAVRARVHDERSAHENGLRQGVVGMAAEDDVESMDPCRQLQVDGDAVVREQHDQVDLLVVPQLVDERLDAVFPNAEGEIGHEAPGVGNRGVGKRLTDDPDTNAAHVPDRVGMEDVVPPPGHGHVVGDEVAGEEPPALTIAEQLLDTLETVDEFPVRREDVHAELVRHPHHVFAPTPERGRRALERVAPVEKQRAPAPFGPDPLDERREVGIAAHPAVSRRQCRKVEVRVRIGLDGAGGDVVRAEELGAGEERRPATLGADPEDRVGLAIEHGAERRVSIRDVQQRDVAERLECEQARGTVGRLEPPRRQPSARRDREELDQVAPADLHAPSGECRAR